MDASAFTGTQVNYYAICHRKLWLFSRDIEMERKHEAVQIGRLLSEESYAREPPDDRALGFPTGDLRLARDANAMKFGLRGRERQ